MLNEFRYRKRPKKALVYKKRLENLYSKYSIEIKENKPTAILLPIESRKHMKPVSLDVYLRIYISDNIFVKNCDFLFDKGLTFNNKKMEYSYLQTAGE